MTIIESLVAPSAAVLEAALAYRHLGFSPLPMRGKEPHPSALTLTRGSAHWSCLRDRPASEEEIRTWYACDPGAGVGLITGSATGLIVVDLDTADATSAGLARELEFPWTPQARSGGGGLHVYFSTNRPVATRRNAALPWNGDLLGDGALVVAPPTPGYEWLVAPAGFSTDVAYEWWSLVAPLEAELLAAAFPSLSEASLAPLEALSIGGFDVRDLFQSEPSREREPSRESSYTALHHLHDSDSYDWVPDVASDGALAAWDRYEPYVRAVFALLEVTVGGLVPGARCLCVLPGHEESNCSASLWADRRGRVVYRCWHLNRVFTLAEVFAARVSGRIQTLSGPRYSAWKLRLLIATGFRQPAPVEVPPIPDAPRVVRRAYEGWCDLFACRWSREYGTPAPFTKVFGAAWCGGMSESRFITARKWLLDRGVFVSAGSDRHIPLFLPGTTS